MLQNFHRKDTIAEHQSIQSLSTHCRVCLASSSTTMIYLFNERPIQHQHNEEVTLLVKLNYCSCFTTEANVDDGLPQYICMSCSILIENAYQLKNLCAKTEAKLHELVRSDLVTAQQSKISNVKVERADDAGLNEENEHEHTTNVGSDEHNVKSNVSSTISTLNTKLREDVDLIEMEDTYGRDSFSFKDVKSNMRKTKMKSDANTKTAAAYQCELCCKWFRIKTTLAIHMRSHTNERPYTCEVHSFFHLM